MIEFPLSCLPDESLSVLLNYTLSKFQFHMCGKVAPEKGNNSSELFCSLPSTQLSHNINNVGIAGKFLKYLEFHCILIDSCFSGLIKVWFALLSDLPSRECAKLSVKRMSAKKTPRLKGIESSIGKKAWGSSQSLKKGEMNFKNSQLLPSHKSKWKTNQNIRQTLLLFILKWLRRMCSTSSIRV